MEFGIGLAIATLIGFISLLIGTKIAGMHVTVLEVLVISVLAGLFTMIPKVGGPFGAVIMLVTLSKWSDADFWPDTVANVAVAQILALAGSHFLTPMVVEMVA